MVRCMAPPRKDLEPVTVSDQPDAASELSDLNRRLADEAAQATTAEARAARTRGTESDTSG